MSDVDQLEQWRLSAQKNSATTTLSQEDDLEQWRLQARQKQQAPTPSPAPNKSPVEAPKPSRGLMERLFSKPTEEETAQADARRKATPFVGRGSSPTGRDVKAQAAAREAAFNKEVEEGKVVPFEKLHQDDKRFQTIKDFMATIGKPYDDKTSREDFTKQYMREMRFMEMNDVGTVKLLTKLNNSDKAAAAKLANAYKLFEQVPSAGVRGGQGGMSPLLQNAIYAITSPTNLASLGAGAVAKSVAKSAGKSLLKQNLAGVGVGGVTDVVGSVGSDALLQKAEQDAQRQRTDLVDETEEEKIARQTKPFELDTTRTAINVLVSAAMTGVAAKGISAAADAVPKRTLQQKIAAAAPMPPPAVVAAAKKEVIDATNAQMDEEVKRFVKEQGEAVLREQGPAGPITHPVVRENLSRNAVEVAMNVIKLDPSFAPKENQLISDAIQRVFSSIDSGDINDAVLEASIRKAGLTPAEFASANKITITEAAKVMQQYSVAARMMNKLRGIDSNFDKEMSNLYGDVELEPGIAHNIVEGIRRVERESKAIVVSGPATTFRNILGSSAGMMMKSATKLLDGIIYTSYKGIESLVTDKPQKYTFGKNLARTMHDTLRPWRYMANQGMSKELTELLLKDNPSMQARLLGLQEDDKGVSKLAKMVNVLNQWQDGLYRRAAFAESVDQQLSDVGMDLFSMLKSDKAIPKDVLVRAADDAMKATMSYMPKQHAKGAGVDAMVERGASMVVKSIEAVPTGSVWIATFPRFMANALAFQYRYSPLGAFSLAGDRAAYKAAAKSGDEASTALARRQMLNHGSQAVVGTAIFLQALDYRRENQDTEWFNLKNNDGTVSDVRSIFPLAPYLGAADVYVKMTERAGTAFDARGVFETIVGMKMPAGSTNTFLDQIASAMDSEDVADAWGVTVGKMVGDFAGRFSQPFVSQQVYDLIDALKGESTARDPNVLDGKVGGVEMPKWLEAGAQRVQKNIPGAKEELAPAAPRLSDREDVKREGELINRIIGFRSVAEPSDVAKEAIRLGLKSFEMFGRPTGDKAVDNQIVRAINEVALPRIEAYIQSPDYKALPNDLERAKLFKSVMSSAVSDVRQSVIDKQDNVSRAKIEYKKMAAEDRKRVNAKYREMNNGKSLEEAEDYIAAQGILEMLNAGIGLNKGGFVSRR
jgi:hypothetical protein